VFLPLLFSGRVCVQLAPFHFFFSFSL
jgi:hypothetical protein